MKRSESVSGVFPEFFRNFFRKVPAVLGVWPLTRGGQGGFKGGVRGGLCLINPALENLAKDPSVPWSRGVVMWTDAGNFIQDRGS